METYVLDKLKKCLKCGMKQHLFTLMGELGHNVVPCKMSCPKVRPTLVSTKISDNIWSIRKTQSELWGRNMERVRTAEGETGMTPCILVDLFSPPGTSRAERRKLKVICTYSVTLDHMVCSVPCCWGGSLADLEPQETQGEGQPRAGGLMLFRATRHQN